MSSRTFILIVDEKNKDLVEDQDVVNVLAIRILEVYLTINSVEKVGLDVISSVKKLVTENIKFNHNKNDSYYISIDFEKDIVLY
jgi:hypothetical protein